MLGNSENEHTTQMGNKDKKQHRKTTNQPAGAWLTQ